MTKVGIDSAAVIDIIIINYNCVTDLKTLLETLTSEEDARYSRRAFFSITVVDNDSPDGSATMVSTQFPQVKLIAREENDGYAAAVNEGLASTKNREILLLNSDTLVTPSTVTRLSRIWERLDFPGILGPLHFEEDEFPQLTWGAYPSWAAEKERRRIDRAVFNREEWAAKKVLAEACRTREVDWVSGSCMFFPRLLVEDIGPWDQNFFLFFEDIDWCLRAKAKGYPIYHTSEARITHIHGASVDQDPDLSEIEYRRSQCYFTKKHFGWFALMKLRGYLTVKLFGRWLIGSRSGFSRGVSFEIFREIWRKPGI